MTGAEVTGKEVKDQVQEALHTGAQRAAVRPYARELSNAYFALADCTVLTAEETAFLRAVVRRAPAIPRTSALAVLAGEGRDD